MALWSDIKNYLVGSKQNSFAQKAALQTLLVNQRMQQRFTMVNQMMNYMVNQQIYPDIDQQKAIDKGYQGNSAVYSIVNRSARKFGSIPIYLHDNKGKKITGTGSDLESLLLRPNEYESISAFKMKAYSYYKLTGECFVYCVRAEMITDAEGNEKPEEVIRKMPIKEMFILPSNKMSVVQSKDNPFDIAGYKIDLNGQQRDLAKHEVIHWKNLSMDWVDGQASHLRGISPLKAGSKPLTIHEQAQDSLSRSFYGDGARGVFSPKKTEQDVEDFDQADSDSIRRLLDNRINSQDVKNTLAFVPFPMDFTDVGRSPIDLQTLEGKEDALKELTYLFDFPFELFDTTNVDYANKEASMRGWVTNTILPDIKQFCEELERFLLPAFGVERTLRIIPDASELSEMKKDLVALATAMSQSPELTYNEKRIMKGFEPINDPIADEMFIEGLPLSEWKARNSMALLAQEQLSIISDKPKQDNE
jgi:HK97 family phage portal protein